MFKLTFEIFIILSSLGIFIPLIHSSSSPKVLREHDIPKVDREGPAPHGQPPEVLRLDAGREDEDHVVVGSVAVVDAEDGGVAGVVGEELALERVGEDDAVFGGGRAGWNVTGEMGPCIFIREQVKDYALRVPESSFDCRGKFQFRRA